MARKLKTFVTKSGFFEHAIAAPSMKAALEAWGAKTNLFHKGFAKQTSDPKIVAAAMAKPGVVLRRAIGSTGTFKVNAKLPAELATEAKPRSVERRTQTNSAADTSDKATERKAALAFRREEKRRVAARRREKHRQEMKRRRRAKAIAAFERAFQSAARAHDEKLRKLEQQRASLDAQVRREGERWERQRTRLERKRDGAAR